MSDTELKLPAPTPPPEPFKSFGQVEVTLKDRTYSAYIPQPPANAALDELETILKNNRLTIEKAQTELKTAYLAAFTAPKDKPIPLNLAAPTQNAMVAHLTINLIIPIINMRNGGHAYYTPDETLHVKARLEKMRSLAEKQVLGDLQIKLENLPPPEPPSKQLGKATLIVIAIILVLLIFLH